jgi:hypothetical protein
VLATAGGDQLATGLKRSTQITAKSLFGLLVRLDRFGEVGHRIGQLLPLGLGRVLAPAQETVSV